MGILDAIGWGFLCETWVERSANSFCARNSFFLLGGTETLSYWWHTQAKLLSFLPSVVNEKRNPVSMAESRKKRERERAHKSRKRKERRELVRRQVKLTRQAGQEALRAHRLKRSVFAVKSHFLSIMFLLSILSVLNHQRSET